MWKAHLERPSETPFWNAHLERPSGMPIWNNPNNSLGVLSLRISTSEILRRRHKNGDPCFADGTHFDDMVLQKHHNVIGCSPPYQRSNKSTCSSEEELAADAYEWTQIGGRYYPAPCEGMSNIIYSAEMIDYASASVSQRLQLVITYPKTTRIIKQSRSVDLHALIGNIGGYIGLFLGKYFNLMTLNPKSSHFFYVFMYIHIPLYI